MLLATSLSGFWLFAMRYFALEMRPPAHDRASAHFFSEISLLRLARERGSGPGFSTPRVLGFSAAIFAHSSAFSLPVMPWCAGHHRISMVTGVFEVEGTTEILWAEVRKEGGGGGAGCRGRVGRRGGTSSVPSHTLVRGVGRRGVGEGSRFLYAFLLFFLLCFPFVFPFMLSFVIFLGTHSLSWDRPGRRAKRSLQRAAERGLRTGTGLYIPSP